MDKDESIERGTFRELESQSGIFRGMALGILK